MVLIICTFGLASFPGLPCFYLPFVFTIIKRAEKQQNRGRPGSIHHDVRLMQGGHRREGPNCKKKKQCTRSSAQVLYRSSGLQTLAWLKLLILVRNLLLNVVCTYLNIDQSLLRPPLVHSRLCDYYSWLDPNTCLYNSAQINP